MKKHSPETRWRAFIIWQKLGFFPWKKTGRERKKGSRDFYKGALDSIPILNDDAKRTFVHLLLRPGYMIRDYIRGAHERYLAPLTSLIIFYAFFALVSAVLQPIQHPFAEIAPDARIPEGEFPRIVFPDPESDPVNEVVSAVKIGEGVPQEQNADRFVQFDPSGDLIGRLRLYQALPTEVQKTLPTIEIGDQAVNSAVRGFVSNPNFGLKEGESSISMFDMLQLFNHAIKQTSYIDRFVDRNQNCTDFALGIQRALLGSDTEGYNWFLE